MSNIINFQDIPGAITRANITNTTPETVLDNAKNRLSTVIIIGIDKLDESVFVASSSDDGPELNFLIDIAKKKLLTFFDI